MTRSPFKFLDSYQKEDARPLLRAGARNGSAVQRRARVQPGAAVRGLGHWQDEHHQLRARQPVRGLRLAATVRPARHRPQPIARSRHCRRNEDTAAAGDEPITERIRKLYLDHYRPVYLVFDQFEELFFLGSAAEQQRFYDTLCRFSPLAPPAKW